MPISALVLDITGQDVPETGLVFDEGDRDMLLWPVLGSLVAHSLDGGANRAISRLRP